MNTARAPKLSILAFAIVCEELEGIVTANFERAQKLLAIGETDEAERAFAVSESASSKLEALIEGQLAAACERRPSAARVDAALAA